MLTAIEIRDHLIASNVLGVELNENSRITARLIRKGFRIIEVRWAIRCLLSPCLSNG